MDYGGGRGGWNGRQRVVDETLEYFWMKKFGGQARPLGLASPRFHKDVPLLFSSYVRSLGKIR